jgi:MFS family permease
MRPSRTRSPVGAVALGGTATVVCLLPVFLTGALAVPLRSELAFSSVGLGLAVGLFRATGAGVSPFMGRLADRLGAILSIRIATATAATACFGIAATANRWGIFVTWLMLGGAGAALGQPAANRLLSNIVPRHRLGAAFGFKQSAPPTASMLAGLSLPVIALTFGWRWTFVLAGVLALLVGVLAGRRPQASRRAGHGPGSAGQMPGTIVVLVLATAFGLGTATSSVVTTFFVEATVSGGASQRFAGLVLATASATAIAMRIGFGVLADHIRGHHLRLCAALLASGSLGMLALSRGTPTWMLAGGIVALAGTWGFNGVFLYAIVRTTPDMPGRMTGAIAPGALLGATIGPLVFGLLIDSVGYGLVWVLNSLVALMAAAAMLVGDRLLGTLEPGFRSRQ